MIRHRLGAPGAEAHRAALQARPAEAAGRAGAVPVLRGIDARLRQERLAGGRAGAGGPEVFQQLVSLFLTRAVCSRCGMFNEGNGDGYSAIGTAYDAIASSEMFITGARWCLLLAGLGCSRLLCALL